MCITSGLTMPTGAVQFLLKRKVWKIAGRKLTLKFPLNIFNTGILYDFE